MFSRVRIYAHPFRIMLQKQIWVAGKMIPLSLRPLKSASYRGHHCDVKKLCLIWAIIVFIGPKICVLYREGSYWD